MNHIHTFIKSTEFNGYEVCADCGSFHSIAQVDPKVIYEDNPYWDKGDGTTGRSTLEQQCENFVCIDDCGISKADRIFQFVPEGKTALEIACAPGVVLNRLSENGFDAYGIEPSLEYLPFILSKAPKARVLHGYFPSATSGFPDECFDCIIAIDVMEHVEDYDGFFKEGHRLLKTGGTMITMSPIILTADGLFRKRDMAYPSEHCWVHTQKYLEPYLKSIFSHVEFRSWIVGHELAIVKK